MNSTIKRPNSFAYNLTSAISQPLAPNPNPLLKNTIVRIAIAIFAFYSTFGIATILSSVFVDIQNKNFDRAKAQEMDSFLAEIKKGS